MNNNPSERLVRLRKQSDAIELVCGLLAIGMAGAVMLAPLLIWWGQQ